MKVPGSLVLVLALAASCRSPKPCALEPRGNCPGADFSHHDLRGLDLTGINLSGASLAGADLTKANLTDANLTQADLAATTLNGATFKGANLTGAFIPNAVGTGASFEGATFREAALDGTYNDANFRGADFEGTLDFNCLGNAPTLSPAGPRWNPKQACRLKHIPGRAAVCPDGTAAAPSPRSLTSCEGHMRPSRAR